MSPAPTDPKLPVVVLTGFLGSGKTTLLQQVLRSPAMADTAVIINEAGAMALDHLLARRVDEQILELPSGCLCCVRRLDIVTSLHDLLERRDSGAVKPFSRIVIETSGLADPAPILYTLAADPLLGQRLGIAAVATLVDAVAGEGTLRRHPEATSQVAVADRVIITKTDLRAPSASLMACLDTLNDWAERAHLPGADDPAALLFGPLPRLASRRRPTAQAVPVEATHTASVATLSLVLTRPMSRLAFAQALGGLARDHGEDLLRAKGLVMFADRPGRVGVIHAVQHTLYPPDWLDDWPDDDQRCRLVFIVRGIPDATIMSRFAAGAPVPWTPAVVAAAAA